MRDSKTSTGAENPFLWACAERAFPADFREAGAAGRIRIEDKVWFGVDVGSTF
jgi:hypothetical protein